MAAPSPGRNGRTPAVLGSGCAILVLCAVGLVFASSFVFFSDACTGSARGNCEDRVTLGFQLAAGASLTAAVLTGVGMALGRRPQQAAVLLGIALAVLVVGAVTGLWLAATAA